MKSVFLTGASGFIGSRLAPAISSNYYLRQAFRKSPDVKPLSDYVLCDFYGDSKLSLALKNIDVVIHCAGRAHLLNDNGENPINEFRKINVDITLRLARESAKSGVKRFIFLSSIGVNGSFSTTPFREEDTPSPVQDYAISKLEAEQGLQEIALSTGMEVVIIRPPLVYGPNAPGNFAVLMHWMLKNIPLPFGAIHNKRSFVGIDNLVDLIITCIEHPAAANQIFLAGDGEDLSTTELLYHIASALGNKAWLIPVNQKILEISLRVIGKKYLAQQLCGSLQVDISKAKKLLNWTPPVGIKKGLLETAQYFLDEQSR